MDPRTLAGQIAGVGRYQAQRPDRLVVVNNTFCAEALAACWGMPPSELMVAVRGSLLHEDGSLRFGVWTQNDETFIQVRPRRGRQRGKGNNKGGGKGSMRGGNKGVGKGKGFVEGVGKGLGKGGGVGKGSFDEASGDEDEADADRANDDENEPEADLRMFKDFLEFRAGRYAPY